MLTLQNLNPKGFPTDSQTDDNLQDLLDKLLQVEKAYGHALAITSGLRDIADQKRIYAEKNAARAKQGLPPLTVPLASKHLYGQAADVADASGNFWKWCMVNMKIFEDLGLYFEDRSATPTWVHIQTVAPKSGKRVFMP